MSERIYDPRHDFDPEHVLHVETTTDNKLRLIVIDGEQTSTIELGSNGARALRLALSRWERSSS